MESIKDIMSKKEFHIFQLNFNDSIEYIYARTHIEALQSHMNLTGYSFYDYEAHDELSILPKDKWDVLKVKVENPNYDPMDDNSPSEIIRTFREHVATLNEPEFFSSTLWD